MMRSDPWGNIYCCNTQQAFATVVPSVVDDAISVWISNVFDPADDIRVRVVLVRRVDESEIEPEHLVLDDVAGDLPDEFDTVDVDEFNKVFVSFFHNSRLVDPSTIVLVVSAGMLGLIYSHRFGDETVFMPKSERLFLALSGLSPDCAPDRQDRRPLTARRIVEGGLRMSVARPKASFGAIRQIVGMRNEVPRPVARPDESGIDALDSRAWWYFARLEGSTDRKLPSVYFYCALLAALGRGAHESHHVVADLRSYSPVLGLTDGNAFSHIPFRADWSVDDPADVARELSSRIRSGEALIRRSVGEVVARAADYRHGSSGGAGEGDEIVEQPLTTSMSCFRLPADRPYAKLDGRLVYSGGMQTYAPNALSINIRATGNVSDCTFSHSGGHVAKASLMAAVKTAAGLSGADVTMETGFHFGER
ncbi:hypothetical protein [Rhodococcus sp. IEGM 1406]|uniref:hypothetical protein n=1 Tax=Rhodococcus sp. IEGM 1406 TaxID=3047083 RepID=UPI0024B844CA|nr:hypothetical protein [Rhodococcus sp. IEGM 1406]MDI9905597.1 hypothetical protein [Rhodococcus sp. IEGM 1406]